MVFKNEILLRESFEALIKSAEEKWTALSEVEKIKFKQDPEVKTFIDNEIEIWLKVNNNQQTLREQLIGAKLSPKKRKVSDKPQSEEEAKEQDVKPKRPLCSFLIFKNELMKELRASEKSMDMISCCKEAGDRWAKMDAVSREKYVELAHLEKLRELQQLAQLKEHGFFIMSDGSKSTDLPLKKRRAAPVGPSKVAKK